MDRRTTAAKMLLRDMTEVTQGAWMGPKNDSGCEAGSIGR